MPHDPPTTPKQPLSRLRQTRDWRANLLRAMPPQTGRDEGTMTPDDQRHGTKAGYQAGCRATCCKRAQALYSNLHRLSGPRRVPVLGTQRRIEALRAMGWDDAALCRRLGWDRCQLRKVGHGQSNLIYGSTARTIAALYDELHMTRPDGPIADRTRKLARSKGYAPPLAWDCIDTDAKPNYGTRGDDRTLDPVIVERVLAGEWRLPATRPERQEICRRYLREGSANELARLTGWKVERYYRIKEAA